MKKPKLLRVSMALAEDTNPMSVSLCAAKVKGLLSHFCPGTHQRIERKTLIITHIRTGDELLLTKAICGGVAEGMDLTIADSEFDTHDAHQPQN